MTLLVVLRNRRIRFPLPMPGHVSLAGVTQNQCRYLTELCPIPPRVWYGFPTVGRCRSCHDGTGYSRLTRPKVSRMSDGQSHEEVHARAQLRRKHQLTLPPQVRDALHLVEGDEVEFTVHADGQVTLRGMTSIPTDQRWFWTEEWQAGEREASEQIAAGDLPVYDDMAALFADID